MKIAATFPQGILLLTLLAVAPLSARQGSRGQGREPRGREPFSWGEQSPAQRHGGEGRAPGGHGAVWQDRRARDWKSEHRDWRERGGYHGYLIPEASYRRSFGPDHAFRIEGYPLSVSGGYPQFQYGGVWISVVDPWPEFWPATWYDDDEVYIEYSGGGYYMRNRQYPQDRISISIRLN